MKNFMWNITYNKLEYNIEFKFYVDECCTIERKLRIYYEPIFHLVEKNPSP